MPEHFNSGKIFMVSQKFQGQWKKDKHNQQLHFLYHDSLQNWLLLHKASLNVKSERDHPWANWESLFLDQYRLFLEPSIGTETNTRGLIP